MSKKNKVVSRKGKIIPISKFKKAESSKMGFNTNTIIIAVVVFILFSIFWNFNSSQIDAREISMNDLPDHYKYTYIHTHYLLTYCYTLTYPCSRR